MVCERRRSEKLINVMKIHSDECKIEEKIGPESVALNGKPDVKDEKIEDFEKKVII